MIGDLGLLASNQLVREMTSILQLHYKGRLPGRRSQAMFSENLVGHSFSVYWWVQVSSA